MIFKDNIITLILFYLFLLLSLVLGFVIGTLVQKIIFKKQESSIREDAIKRSKSILAGQFIEVIAPFFPNFPYNPKDLKFLGSPIDYIVFDGLTNGKLKEVIFLEIKSGKSKLNDNEKQLKNIIDKKAISYKEYRINL